MNNHQQKAKDTYFFCGLPKVYHEDGGKTRIQLVDVHAPQTHRCLYDIIIYAQLDIQIHALTCILHHTQDTTRRFVCGE